MIRKMIYFLTELNIGIYIFIFFVAHLLIQLPFFLIGIEFQNSSVDSIKNDLGLTGLFVLSVIIVPIFETLIFQIIIIEGFRYFLRNLISLNLILIFSTITSSLAFASDHIYSINYFIGAFCSGFIYAVLYNISKFRKEAAFIFPLILHSVWNLFVFFMSDILDL